MSPRVVGALIGSGIALPALIYLREYPWQLALPVAIAIGLLVFSAISSYENLRRRR